MEISEEIMEKIFPKFKANGLILKEQFHRMSTEQMRKSLFQIYNKI